MLPSKAKLDRYLADRAEAVTQYTAMLASIGVEIARLTPDQIATLAIDIAERHADQLVSAVLRLAGLMVVDTPP